MLVKDAVLQFVREADPNGTAGVEITASNLDSLNGEKLTKERRLAIYNDARRIVFDELLRTYGKISDHVTGFLISEAVLAWTNYTSYSTASLPNGYIAVPDDESSVRLGNVPIRLRVNPGTLLGGNNPDLTQDATTIFAYERATDFVHFGNPPADSLIATAATSKINYLGIIDWTLANIASASTTQECFLETDQPLVQQTALTLARNENDAAKAIAEIRSALKR